MPSINSLRSVNPNKIIGEISSNMVCYSHPLIKSPTEPTKALLTVNREGWYFFH